MFIMSQFGPNTMNYLILNINHKFWYFSCEDNLVLWEWHKQYGKWWVKVSAKLFKTSSFPKSSLKNWWHSESFKKFIANKFGSNAHRNGKKEGQQKRFPKIRLHLMHNWEWCNLGFPNKQYDSLQHHCHATSNHMGTSKLPDMQQSWLYNICFYLLLCRNTNF